MLSIRSPSEFITCSRSFMAEAKLIFYLPLVNSLKDSLLKGESLSSCGGLIIWILVPFIWNSLPVKSVYVYFFGFTIPAEVKVLIYYRDERVAVFSSCLADYT